MQARNSYHFDKDGQARRGIILGGRGAPQPDSFALPCGKCLGCKTTNKRGWAIRCQLENTQHEASSFVTLTYAGKYLPPTLAWNDHVQPFLKRLRQSAKRSAAAPTIRYFGCGEYGTERARPHYHLILFGLGHLDRERLLVDNAWQLGRTSVEVTNPRTIAYTVGYTYEKLEWDHGKKHERVDPETGEVYTYQPAFSRMSRRPGIAAHARQYLTSWREHAIHNGNQVPVPRYLHEAWKQHATPHEITQLQIEKQNKALTRNTTPGELAAKQTAAETQHAINQAKRNKL